MDTLSAFFLSFTIVVMVLVGAATIHHQEKEITALKQTVAEHQKTIDILTSKSKVNP
jgi:aryl-alcohol dehydrogenase-like predicted oxidoreductase